MPTDTAKPKRPVRKATAHDDGLTVEKRIERDAARYEALAREHRADLGGQGFNEALKKVSRAAPQSGK